MSLAKTLPLGCTKDDLDTPALCLDLDTMDANLRAVAATCRGARVAWRPHSKGHKNTWIARQQLDAGAIGITCAKLGEAEVMAAGGIHDLLIANQVVGPHKVARLVELRRIADPIICVDHLDQALPVSSAMAAAGLRLRVLIEVDLGLKRAGVAPGEAAVALARQLHALPGIELAGVMGYEGHLLTVADPTEKQSQIAAALASLVECRRLIEKAGLPCGIVSCGGSGSYLIACQQPGLTELQAGGAIFMDAFYRQRCGVVGLDYALTILSTVVARPTADRAIIDAGRKTMNIEVHTPLVVGRDGLTVTRLSAEHGDLRIAADVASPKIGERLELIPGYADLTVMLHDVIHGFRAGRLERILPVESRGMVQ